MSESRKVIYTGLAANVAVAIASSSPRLSPAAPLCWRRASTPWSIAATLFLLLFGVYRSQLPADEDHPFGHGKELYFWSFVVAVSMFAVGGVLSVWEGIDHWRHPVAIENHAWSYLILLIATVMNAGSLAVAVRAAYPGKRRRRRIPFHSPWQGFRRLHRNSGGWQRRHRTGHCVSCHLPGHKVSQPSLRRYRIHQHWRGDPGRGRGSGKRIPRPAHW